MGLAFSPTFAPHPLTSCCTRTHRVSSPDGADPSSYLSEWALLVQLLSHTAEKRFNVGSADKQSTKEAAASFFERLAELEAVCRQHPFSRQDPELRERIGTEVSDFVRQGYASFWTKAHSKGYDKYLRQTPDELHRRMQNVFR